MTTAALATLGEVFVRCRDMDAALGERLEAYSRAVRTLIPEYATAVDQLVSRLSDNSAGMEAPALGEPTRYPFRVLTDLDNGYAMSLNLATHAGGDVCATPKTCRARASGSSRCTWSRHQPTFLPHDGWGAQ